MNAAAVSLLLVLVGFISDTSMLTCTGLVQPFVILITKDST
jgi:hypothetical protein